MTLPDNTKELTVYSRFDRTMRKIPNVVVKISGGHIYLIVTNDDGTRYIRHLGDVE